jgi:hypothetical protein
MDSPTPPSSDPVFSKEITKATKGLDIYALKLRVLRALRGEGLLSFGCGFAALGSM